MQFTFSGIGYYDIMLNCKPAANPVWDDFRVYTSDKTIFPLYMYSSVKTLREVFKYTLSFLAFLAIALPTAQAQDPWPMFRQNGFHTGYTSFNGPLAPDIAWQYNTGGYTYSSPVVTTDRVYIASQNELIALNHAGDELWAFTFNAPQNPPAVEISGFVSTPAVAPDGTIYIGSLDENLYAINPDGSLKWTFDAGGQVFASPTLAANGTIFIGSRSGQFSAVNPNGSLLWWAFVSGEIFSSATLDGNSTVYFGATDNRLYAYNTGNGGLAWTFQAQGEIVSSPALGNGNVYFGSIDNRVYAVNTANGSAAWAAPFQTNGEIISSPAVGPDGTVYIGSFDNRFYAINGLTGTAKWQSPFVTGEIIAASPAIDGFGNIYITSLDGSMYVMSDGNTQPILLWSFPTGNPIWASPAIGPNNSVFVAATGSESEAGRLFSIHQATYSLTFASQLIAGQEAPFNVGITGTLVPASGTLFYRPAGAADYEALPFSASATIPGTAITGTGLEYYIVGAEGTYPDESPAERPASRRVFINSDTAPDVFFPRIHRMISVPYELTDKSIQDVLVDDYQTYGPQSWRLHRWNGSGFEEFPDITNEFTPGTAFFLVTTSGAPFNVGSGFSVDTSLPYAIDLEPGWNQIGNPFGFPVEWSRVIRNPEIVNAIAFFDGSEMIQDPDEVGVLAPWEGYFVYNDSDKDVTIQIPPTPAPILVEEIPEGEAVAASKHAAGVSRIQITASIAALGLEDSQNWIGFHPEASDALDAFDVQEAPPFGENVRLSLLEMDGVQGAEKAYAVNMKPRNEAGNTWPLQLTTSSETALRNKATVTLRFDQQGADLADLEMVLIDEDYGFARLISDGEVQVNWGDNPTTRRFTLVTGTRGQIDNMLSDTPIAPTQTVLDPNFPNPFQQNTRIGYQLSDRLDVTLKIYNLLGQEVQTLVRSTQNPGKYETAWDGSDAAGRPVGSGIYIYRLQAGTFSASGKMALVR